MTKRRTLSRRQFLQLSLAGGASATGLGTLYARWVEPRWLEVTRLTIPLPGWPTVLNDLTVAHISDLHVGPYVRPEDVAQVVRRVNALKPDLIILTGDFVYRSASYAAPCAQALASLQARYGVYAVLGNHDIWTDADEVAARLSRVGITVLRNERRGLRIGQARLWLLGIEDLGYTGFRGSSFGDFRAIWQRAVTALRDLLTGIPDEEPRLLLVHNPDFAEMLPQGRIDLVLCGHTHGGQVRFPLIGPPILPSSLGQKYAAGLVRGPSAPVYVNRGIGVIWPPIRLNCRPEITRLRLRGEAL